MAEEIEKRWREIAPADLKENLFTKIADDWMLITARDKSGRVNTMTASWGGFGVLWGRPVCQFYIRPQRYTLRFVDEAEVVTLSFLEEGHRDALTLCGRKSGRDCDKIAEAGLHPVAKDGAVWFDEAKLVVTGKKLYRGQFREENFLAPETVERNYPAKDFHYVFICSIEKILTR